MASSVYTYQPLLFASRLANVHLPVYLLMKDEPHFLEKCTLVSESVLFVLLWEKEVGAVLATRLLALTNTLYLWSR